MKKLIAILVFLISGIAITGISFIDGEIWRIIFLIIGMISYFVVGFLFSLGILSTKKDGQDAYAFIFLILVLGGIGVYYLLHKFRQWILSWPLYIKIIVPSIIIVCLIICIIFVIRKIVLEKRKKAQRK